MKRTLTLLLLLLLPAPAFAQQSMTLLQAIDRAVHTNPVMQVASADVARAQSGIREAKAAWLPTLGLDASLNRFEEPTIVAPLHGLDLRNPPVFDRTLSQQSLTAGYTLFDASRGARIDRANAFEQAAESGAAAMRMQLLSDVARAWLAVQTTRAVLMAHDRRIAALTQEQWRAQQLVEQGRAARVVLMRAQAALSSASADQIAAASNVEVAENALARLIGVPPDSMRLVAMQSLSPTDENDTASVDARALARTSNPQLQQAQRQIAAAQATRAEARGAWLPRVTLGGRYVDYTSTKTAPQLEWQGGAQLSYPILTGGARRAANERADAEVRAAQAQYDVAQRQLDDAIDRAISARNAAHARVAALSSAVAQSEEVARIEKLALDTGEAVQTDYLTAQADLFRARAALSDAVAAEIIARVEIARVTGQLNEDWIAQNLEQHQ